MAWADITRREHRYKELRNSSGMKDRQWMVTAPFILAAKRSEAAKRPAAHDGHGRGGERDGLHCRKRMRVAVIAQMLSTVTDSAALFLRLAPCRAV